MADEKLILTPEQLQEVMLNLQDQIDEQVKRVDRITGIQNHRRTQLHQMVEQSEKIASGLGQLDQIREMLTSQARRMSDLEADRGQLGHVHGSVVSHARRLTELETRTEATSDGIWREGGLAEEIEGQKRRIDILDDQLRAIGNHAASSKRDHTKLREQNLPSRVEALEAKAEARLLRLETLERHGATRSDRLAELEARTQACPKVEIDIENLGIWRDKAEQHLQAIITAERPPDLPWAQLLTAADALDDEELRAYVRALAVMARGSE